jgi:predicted PurR-regulated permease PerM
MNEWSVVTVLIALAGLFATVGAPIISLNKNIATLNAEMKRSNARLDKHDQEFKAQQANAHESHQKLWEKNNEQDKILGDHETRIKILENT